MKLTKEQLVEHLNKLQHYLECEAMYSNTNYTGTPNYISPWSYNYVVSVCDLISCVFCGCKYVEYFVFDLDFGRNQTDTEMGVELRGLTIETFVDLLYSKL